MERFLPTNCHANRPEICKIRIPGRSLHCQFASSSPPIGGISISVRSRLISSSKGARQCYRFLAVHRHQHHE